MDKRTINNLSLCSGGAGLDLGVELAMGATRTVCWVEWEAFAIEFLASCMEAKCLPQAPIWSDLRTFDGRPWRGVVDFVTAGYPCQPFSLAGKRRGEDDPRHLWPHVHRVIGEVEPAGVFLENVPGHLNLGFDKVASNLEDLGYEIAAGLFTAEEVGATHKRERLFILALDNAEGFGRGKGWSKSEGWKREPVSAKSGRTLADVNCTSRSRRYRDKQQTRGWRESANKSRPMADSKSRGTDAVQQPRKRHLCQPVTQSLFPPGPSDDWSHVEPEFWPASSESDLRFVADGLAKDRTRFIKLLGNGVVPLQAAYAFCSLFAALRDT